MTTLTFLDSHRAKLPEDRAKAMRDSVTARCERWRLTVGQTSLCVSQAFKAAKSGSCAERAIAAGRKMADDFAMYPTNTPPSAA